jgi:hypothetical protein
MTWTTIGTIRRVGASSALACATALLITSGSSVLAQSNASQSSNGIEGAWLVQVTVRNCATGRALGSFNSLVTFQRGGTMSEATSSPSFAVGQRSPGHGVWDAQGQNTYSQRMVALINFDTPPAPPVSPGFFAGWSTVTHTVEQIDRDHIASTGTNDFYKSDGTLYRSGCSTAVGERFN